MNKNELIKELLSELSYRSNEGYPMLDNREQISILAEILDEWGYTKIKNELIENLGSNFIIHRSFSLIILLVQIFITYLVFIRSKYSKEFRNILIIMLMLIVSEILVGAGMAYFEVPRVLQPIHLLLAFMIVGLQFYIYLKNSNIKKVNSL